MIDGLRGTRPGSILIVVGHPTTEQDAEREEGCGDDERAEQQHRRTPLVATELFKRRMRTRRPSRCGLAFAGRNRPVLIG